MKVNYIFTSEKKYLKIDHNIVKQPPNSWSLIIFQMEVYFFCSFTHHFQWNQEGDGSLQEADVHMHSDDNDSEAETDISLSISNTSRSQSSFSR